MQILGRWQRLYETRNAKIRSNFFSSTAAHTRSFIIPKKNVWVKRFLLCLSKREKLNEKFEDFRMTEDGQWGWKRIGKNMSSWTKKKLVCILNCLPTDSLDYFLFAAAFFSWTSSSPSSRIGNWIFCNIIRLTLNINFISDICITANYNGDVWAESINLWWSAWNWWEILSSYFFTAHQSQEIKFKSLKFSFFSLQVTPSTFETFFFTIPTQRVFLPETFGRKSPRGGVQACRAGAAATTRKVEKAT